MLLRITIVSLILLGLSSAAPVSREERATQHHGAPPCGLPLYAEDLPEDARNKLEEIWKDYKEGDKCYHEHGLTRDLIESLPKKDRNNLLKNLIPNFLRKAPKDVQQQFRVIFSDHTIPLADKSDKIRELAEKVLSPELLKEFNEHEDKLEKAREAFAKKVSTLSPEAKKVYERLEKLDAEKREIFHTTSDKIKEELFELYREKPCHGHRCSRG